MWRGLGTQHRLFFPKSKTPDHLGVVDGLALTAFGFLIESFIIKEKKKPKENEKR